MAVATQSSYQPPKAMITISMHDGLYAVEGDDVVEDLARRARSYSNNVQR